MTDHEFDCIDCGRHIVTFWRQAEVSRRCATCTWIEEQLDPECRSHARKRLGVPLRENRHSCS